MINYIKQLSKDSILYGFGTAFGQLFSFVLAPILTSIFSPSDYGIISLLQTVFGFMIMIALVNLSSGVYFYYFDIKNAEKRKAIISTSIIFHVFIALLFSILVWFLAPYFSDVLNMQESNNAKYYDYTNYIKILSFGIFFSVMDTQFKSLLRMLRRPIKFVILTMIYVVVNFIMIIYLVVYLELGIEGTFYAGVISTIISSLVGFLMVKNEYTKTFSVAYLFLFFSYALPQFPSVFFNWGLSQSNRFFLNYYSNLSEQGLYAIGLKIASIFLLFAMAFRLAWDPFALSIKDDDNAKFIYKKFYIYFILFFAWLASTVSLFGKPVLLLLTPPSYHSAYVLVIILSFAFLMQNVNNIIGIGISITKKTSYISYIQFVVFVVVIVASFVLIPLYDSIGAAFVFLIGSVVQGILYFIVSEKLYKVGYDFWKMKIYLFFLAILTMLGIKIINSYDVLWIAFIIAAIFSILLALCSIMVFVYLEKKWIFKK